MKVKSDVSNSFMHLPSLLLQTDKQHCNAAAMVSCSESFDSNVTAGSSYHQDRALTLRQSDGKESDICMNIISVIIVNLKNFSRQGMHRYYPC